MAMKKFWWQSKSIQGVVGFVAFSLMNTFFPDPMYQSAAVAALGWAGYGFRDALK